MGTDGGDLGTADWGCLAGSAPACVCMLHTVAVQQATLVSDESALEACSRRCAIQIDDLFLLPFIGCCCVFTGVNGKHRRVGGRSYDDDAPMETIFVKDVKGGGAASLAGLQVGDRIVMVNNEDIVAKSYAQVVALIKTRFASPQRYIVALLTVRIIIVNNITCPRTVE